MSQPPSQPKYRTPAKIQDIIKLKLEAMSGGYVVDYLGLFIGLASGELVNILHGLISKNSGIARETISYYTLVIYVLVMAYLIMRIGNRVTPEETKSKDE